MYSILAYSPDNRPKRCMTYVHVFVCRYRSIVRHRIDTKFSQRITLFHLTMSVQACRPVYTHHFFRQLYRIVQTSVANQYLHVLQAYILMLNLLYQYYIPLQARVRSASTQKLQATSKFICRVLVHMNFFVVDRLIIHYFGSYLIQNNNDSHYLCSIFQS